MDSISRPVAQTFSRLVTQFAPSHYDLSVLLERLERQFQGTVTITGQLAELPHNNTPFRAGELRLHAKDLVISSALVDGKKATFKAEPNDELVITHPDLTAGKHLVTIGFSGTITDDMNGIYPCYFEDDGHKKELIATQFESHSARQAFPCVDEPEAKASFSVSLTTEPNVTVLGNMPIASQTTENGKLVTHFETTPTMSSYLVAWAVGELHKKTAITKRGVEVSVWATPAHPARSLDFALDIATRCIDFFESYFGVEYPLPKSDHVALPDFSAGAMENWGLITYREIALLADPRTATLAIKQQAALTIAHELSHQWFGNLVTMKWWDDLWLNESFANMMEYVAIDALEPSWDVWVDQAAHEVVSALHRDSLDGVQAIQTTITHPDEISTLFDPSIVYAKGGRLLRMLQAYIGEPALRAGLKAYFTSHAYGNTQANNLWQALGAASGKDIPYLMQTWMTRPGYPIVHASLADGQPATVQLSQERFFVGPHDPTTATDDVWPIPLHASAPDAPQLMTTAQLSLPYTPVPGTPLRLNRGATSHFIAHYDTALYADILKHLQTLSSVDRLCLVHEQLLLSKAGIQPTAAIIPLLQQFANETNEAVWGSLSAAINSLKSLVDPDTLAETNLRRLVRELAQAQYDRLGWDAPTGESDNDTKLRGTIIALSLYGDSQHAVNEARTRYLTTPLHKLDNELRVPLLAQAVRSETTPTIVQDLVNAYSQETVSELREDLALALTSTRSEQSIAYLAGLLKDTEFVRMQDFTHWFVWLIRNRYGRSYMWDWIRREWPWVKKTFMTDSSYEMLPRYIASSLATPQQLQQYTDFFAPKQKELSLARNITMGITELAGRVELIERDTPAVRAALESLYSR